MSPICRCITVKRQVYSTTFIVGADLENDFIFQVQKFRQALKKDKSGKCDDITVGTVEEFQGQERRIIIISTVRSSTDFLPLDYDCKLGFLRNPKVREDTCPKSFHHHYCDGSSFWNSLPLQKRCTYMYMFDLTLLNLYFLHTVKRTSLDQ